MYHSLICPTCCNSTSADHSSVDNLDRDFRAYIKRLFAFVVNQAVSDGAIVNIDMPNIRYVKHPKFCIL